MLLSTLVLEKSPKMCKCKIFLIFSNMENDSASLHRLIMWCLLFFFATFSSDYQQINIGNSLSPNLKAFFSCFFITKNIFYR